MELQFIGHSSFYIKTAEHGILIDPFIEGNPVADFDFNAHKITDILLTHAHADHFGDAIPIAKKTGATITAIFELANYCAKKGVKSQGANIGGRVKFPWGSIRLLNAVHSSSTPDGEYVGPPVSIFLEIEGKKIFHAGDTSLHSDLKMIGDVYLPDVAILPVGDFYTMGAEEAVIATKWLYPEIVIPMHFNTFDVISADIAKFKKKVEVDTSAKCIIMNPNDVLTL